MNNYWELSWLSKGGDLSFGLQHASFKSQLRADPDLSPRKDLQVHLYSSSERSKMPCFDSLSLTVKCQSCKCSFSASNQSPHQGVQATPSRAERNMTFRNHSWQVYSPMQLNILCSTHWSNIFLSKLSSPLLIYAKMSFLELSELVLLS